MTFSSPIRSTFRTLSALVFLTPAQAKAQDPTTPAHTFDAWSYTVRTQYQTSIPGITEASRVTYTKTATASRESFDMDSIRVDTISGQPAHYAGKILITTQSRKDTVVTLLDTVQHTYRRFSNSRAAMFFVQSGLTLAPLSLTGLSIAIDSIGIGPIIDGHQTVHYRQVIHLTLRWIGGGMTKTIVDTTHYDIAPDLNDSRLMIDPLMFGTMVLMDVSSMDTVSHAIAKKFPRGFPLHIEDRMVTTGGLGGTITTSLSGDISKVNHGPVDAVLFTIPPSYTLVSDSTTPAMGRPALPTPGANGANLTP